jgi:predicted alpha/beta superfamily hydrolase
MKIWTILIVVFSLVTIAVSAQTIEIGKKDSLVSSVLKETRNFKIILPSTYEQYSKIKYPVIYVLDGDFLIQATSGILEYMSKTGQIPEMIQVYLSNTNRTKDFTPTQTSINYEGEEDASLENSGGGKEFLKFLNTELVKYIDENYRTNSFNTLIGRSFAGLIGGFDFLQEKTELDGYLLIDPSFWWDEQYTVQFIDEVPTKNFENKKIYISSSDNFEFSNYIEQMRNSQSSYFSKIQDRKIDSAKIKLEYFEQNTHGTVTVPSLYNGLIFIFGDYFLNGMKYKTADEIIYHFTQFSEKNGAEFTPLEPMINWLASIQNDKDKSGSLKLYELNTFNYPESVNALLNLAEQYEQRNMIEKALVVYNRVLEIDTRNIKAIDKIKTLRR